MNSGNIRGKKRRSNHTPAQRSSGQKISLAGQPHLPDRQDSDSQNSQQIADNNDQI
jgi:hypothetical protein